MWSHCTGPPVTLRAGAPLSSLGTGERLAQHQPRATSHAMPGQALDTTQGHQVPPEPVPLLPQGRRQGHGQFHSRPGMSKPGSCWLPRVSAGSPTRAGHSSHPRALSHPPAAGTLPWHPNCPAINSCHLSKKRHGESPIPSHPVPVTQAQGIQQSPGRPCTPRPAATPGAALVTQLQPRGLRRGKARTRTGKGPLKSGRWRK